MEPIAILYVIKNSINDKRYFGITWGKNASIEKRLKEHCNKRGGKILYEAMLEIGFKNFWIEKIKEGPLNYIRTLETRMIRRFSHVRDNKGYNACIVKAIVPSKEGKLRGIQKLKLYWKENPRIISLETRQKISNSLKGHVVSDETRNKLKEALKGLKSSDETKKKISIAVSGDKNGFYGKTHRDDVKQKLSQSKKDFYSKIPKKEKQIKREKIAGENNPMFGKIGRITGEKSPNYTLWLINGKEYTTQDALQITGLSSYKLRRYFQNRKPNRIK